ncbi:zinc-finger of the MIZ type in Nse subunit-domain-containing protein [Lasiosphaeria hispida]|uniref:peptidylprolyl isomerase n=1 Tax=Lasiosphaeria hispida TaxID=260671 RepID=A0AAJ0HEK1_9PEZI|nr:zinc-finger of the MIZ type in Nse subunit-domain-containing protein [Lasiosphaeria hispida]
MPPGRLLLGSRHSRPSGTASSSNPSLGRARGGAAAAPALPAYEAPSHPLNEAGKRAVAELASSHETRIYKQHLIRSTTLLSESVGAINDELANRRGRLAALKERRRARGLESESEDKATEIQQLEEAVAELEAQVTTLTDASEAAIRNVIDYKAEIEDEAAVMAVVHAKVSTQEPRREKLMVPKREKRKTRKQREESDDDDDVLNGEGAAKDEEMLDVSVEDEGDEEPLVGAPQILDEARQAKAAEYAALTAFQRYGLNNDYVSFKKTWHDAQNQEDEVPLPHATTWFDGQGRPTRNAAPEAEDDDLVIERVIVDLKCPLSLQVMKEPYSNHKCKHTFEKSAILDFLQSNSGQAQCPVCTQQLRTTDLFLDATMVRRLKRAEEAERRAREEETSDVEEDGNDSVLVRRTNNIKKERNQQRGVPEIDEDAGDD